MEWDARRMLPHWQVFKEEMRVSLGVHKHPAFTSSAYKSFRRGATNSYGHEWQIQPDPGAILETITTSFSVE